MLIDTNVLIDLVEPRAELHAWATDRVDEAISRGHAYINPLIYAEMSPKYASAALLDEALDPTQIIRRVELPYAAGFPAMQAYLGYRASGGTRTSCLPDFYIGAHAEVNKWSLLTRDVRRFRTYFPDVELLTPDDA